mgnify:FL=1
MDGALRSPGGDVETVYEAGDALLICRFSGEIDVEGLARARALSAKLAADRVVRGVLIDVRHSRPAYGHADFIESAEEFLAIFAPQRCAFVATDDPARARQVMLLETVGFPSAMRVRAFTDAVAARAWLCER